MTDYYPMICLRENIKLTTDAFGLNPYTVTDTLYIVVAINYTIKQIFFASFNANISQFWYSEGQK